MTLRNPDAAQAGGYFLEPLIFANVPAFLWLSYYGVRIAALGREAP
jgi:hypothetical protein